MKFASILVFIPAIAVIASVTSCGGGKPMPQEKGKSGEAATASDMKVDLKAIVEPTSTSETYRKAFNEMAAEYYDMQWISDQVNPGNIDVDKGELEIPENLVRKFGAADKLSASTSPGLKKALKLIGDKLEGKRIDALKEALAEEIDVHSTFDLAALTNPNREAARILIEAGYLIEDLYKLQNHPKAMDYDRQLMQKGDPESIKFFRRMQAPTSLKYGDPTYANAIPTFPDKMFGAIMWPSDMHESIFLKLKESAKDNPQDPLMSPFTVVKKDAADELVWIPNSIYPPFRDLLNRISQILARAAAVEGIDPAFSKQLALQSEALVSRLPYPFEKSDEAWVNSDGQLELIIGPYEPDRDPYETKAFYEFMLAAENPKATEFLGRLKAILPEIEQGIAATVPEGVYAARGIDVNPRLRVVDVILATGMNAGDEGPYLAALLPNIGSYSTEEKRKTVIMATHHAAKLPLLKATAARTLTPITADSIDADAFIMFTTLRALMHDLGPQEDMKLADGRTAAEALGPDFKMLKQSKSGVAAAWAGKFLMDKGIISFEELKQMYAAYLANLFRYIRYGGTSPHGIGAAAEFSYLISNGAIRRNRSLLEIDYDRIHPVLTSYLSEIVVALATADHGKARELLVGYTNRAADRLAEALNKMEKASMPRDVALYYHIEGL